MDLRDSPEEAAFRKRVREFLDANLPEGWRTAEFVMPGGDALRELQREWQRRLNAGGFLGLEWPKEFGGQGASAAEVAIFSEEAAACVAPDP